MKEQKEYLQDIVEIKNLMEKSTRFLSLSGISGVLIGIYALVAVVVARYFMDFSGGLSHELEGIKHIEEIRGLVFLAVFILILSLVTGYWFSYQKAQSTGQRMWNHASRTMMWHFMVPLFAGGCVLLILLSKEMFSWLAPFSLLFYGLALYSVSKFTYTELQGLGWLQIVLGLAGLIFPMYGLWLWGGGFGLGHIVYGLYIYGKYEK